MPMAAAAPVLVFMPTSWSASPRVRVMSSPGRASEPTARIQITSGSVSTLEARSTCDQHHVGRLHARSPGRASSPTPSSSPSTTVDRRSLIGLTRSRSG